MIFEKTGHSWNFEQRSAHRHSLTIFFIVSWFLLQYLIVPVSGQRMSWLIWADAHADLGIRCLCMAGRYRLLWSSSKWVILYIRRNETSNKMRYDIWNYDMLNIYHPLGYTSAFSANSADDKVFFFFQKKKALTFPAKLRQFAWNAKAYFLWK